MKKILKVLFVLIMLVSLFAMSACSSQTPREGNMVVNGTFEEGTSIIPTGWTAAYENEVNSIIEIKNYQDISSGNYVLINNTSANRAYLYQTITVEAGATYRVSAKIFIESAIAIGDDNNFEGAYVGFLEDNNLVVNSRTSTTETWDSGDVDYHFYVTIHNKNSVNICVSLGAVGGNSIGIAMFDDVEMVKVDDITVITNIIYNLGQSGANLINIDSGTAYIIIGTLLSSFILAYAYYAMRKAHSKSFIVIGNNNNIDKSKFFNTKGAIITLVVVALLVRIGYSFFLYGATEISLISNYVSRLLESGPSSFYASYSNNDILPVYLYSLWAMSGITSLLGTSGIFNYMLLRLPAIICDVVAVYFVYRIARKHFEGIIPIIFAGLYAFVPFILSVSSIWGSTDSILALLIILSFNFLLDKRIIAFTITFTIALLTKAQAIYVLPLVLAYFVYLFIKQPELRKKLLILLTCSIVGFYLVSLPFTINQIANGEPFFVYTQYFKILTAVKNYYTLNTPNIYGLFGLNRIYVGNTSNLFNYALFLLISLFSIFVYFKNRNRSELILLAAFVLGAISIFALRAQPSYIMVMLALILLYTIVGNDKRTYFVFSAFALINFVNSAYNMNLSSLISSNEAVSLISESSTMFFILSALNILTMIYFTYVVYDICMNNKRVEIQNLSKFGKVKSKSLFQRFRKDN